jgi:hypothetical protein
MIAEAEECRIGEYLLTERDMSAQNGRIIPHPIRLFELETMGIDSRKFIDAFEPSYLGLPWDTYDIRQSQIAHVISQNPSCLTPDNIALMKQYYLTETKPELLAHLLELLPPGQRGRMNEFRACRRRASSSYLLTLKGEYPQLSLLAQSEFRQDLVADYRTWPRMFAPMTLVADRCPLLRQFLIGVGQMVCEVESDMRQMKLTVHQVSTVARNGRSGTNSPEGIHQDGADYIVSALVVSRSGVEGGVSKLYWGNRHEEFFSTTLMPGQGLFHADTQTSIWHDATPISCIDASDSTVGFRNTIGVDVYLER